MSLIAGQLLIDVRPGGNGFQGTDGTTGGFFLGHNDDRVPGFMSFCKWQMGSTCSLVRGPEAGFGQGLSPEVTFRSRRTGRDQQTFTVACYLVIDFDFTPEEALPLLFEFNQRARPPFRRKKTCFTSWKRPMKRREKKADWSLKVTRIRKILFQRDGYRPPGPSHG